MATTEETDQVARVVQAADDAYQAVRAINHLTFGTIPAPLAYDILGSLKGVGHLMPQALNQLARGLAASLIDYDVYQDDGADPAVKVAQAHACLRRAAELAADVGRLLEDAQSAIRDQGYRVGPSAAW